MEPDYSRLLTISTHWTNTKKHNRMLLHALEAIRDNTQKAQELAEKALKGPYPPHPLANFYKDGFHTGHPQVEYLDLPDRDPPDAPVYIVP